METQHRNPLEKEIKIQEKKKNDCSDKNYFSKDQIETLLKENNFKCMACGAENKDNTEKELQPHLVEPINKSGQIEVKNGVILCDDCHKAVHEVAILPHKEKPKLTKTTKRKLWKTKGRICEDCATEFTTGGSHQTIHPFRPINWNGNLESLKVLCTSCVGVAASKRDKILQLAKKISGTDEV